MPYQRVTRAEFRVALRDRLGPAPFWFDRELHAAIQETLREWNLLTGYWQGRIVVPTLAGVHLVTLPTLITGATHAEWQEQPLNQVKLFELDLAVPTWRSSTHDRPQCWAPVALNLIALYPAPAAASNSLTLDGVLRTPVYTSDTATIDVSETLFQVLLDHARHLCLFKIGMGSWFEDSLSARKALVAEAAKYNDRIGALSIYRAEEESGKVTS